jgi:hypothetical protein
MDRITFDKKGYRGFLTKKTYLVTCVFIISLAVLFGYVSHTAVFNRKMCERLFDDTTISTTTAAQENWSNQVELPPVTPWNSIGGCGAGGSGGGVADGIQWLGNGVHGGLIDVEVMSRSIIRQDFYQLAVAPRFSFKPTWTTTLGVSMPIMSKNGDVSYQSNETSEYHTTGGHGDLTIDFAKAVGFSGEYQMQLSLTLPTGQYDIKRGSDRSMSFLPVDFQKGAGIYSATLQIYRIIDVEDGFWKFDASYTQPFNMKPFSKKNEMLDTYYPAYKDRKKNDRFYYRFKPYGENDLGGYTPPSVSLGAYYAYRGMEGFVHSYGIYFMAPLAVAWIPEPSINVYDPKPDPDHMAWNSALIYQLEFSRRHFPLFLAVSVPLHDNADPSGSFDGPDWDDFGNQWIFAVGIKSTMF